MNLSRASAVLLVVLLGASANAEPATDEPAPADPRVTNRHSSAALVVLVEDEPGDTVTARLERDLRSLGLTVIVLSATPENSNGPAALERTARSLGGIATIRVLAGAQGSELWLFDPATNRALSRTLSRPAGSNPDPSEVALGTLELLRASMMELHGLAGASAVSRCPESKPRNVKPADPSVSTVSLSGALAADLGLRSVGPSLSTVWAAGMRVSGCFGVKGFAALPLFAERRTFAEGQVEVEPLVLGGGVSCSLVGSESPLWPRVSLGVAGARIVTRGIGRDPLRSSTDAVWLAGGYGMLGLGLRVARDVHVNLDATGVLLPQPAVILVDRRQVGTWGAPGGLISLGVEVLARP